METDWFYEILIFQVVIVMVKDKKIRYKTCKTRKNYSNPLLEVDKSNVTSSFQGIQSSLYRFAIFSFHFNCQSVKGQLS